MEPETTALITDPMGVFGFLAAIVAGVFWVSELPRCKKLFEVVPPVIYVYFLPMLATTAGITPSASPLYDWTVPYLLLFALLMLMVSVDVMSIVRSWAGWRSSWWLRARWASSSADRFRS